MQGRSRAGGALILGLVNKDGGGERDRDSKYSRRWRQLVLVTVLIRFMCEPR